MHALACAYAENPGEEALNAALTAALPLCALIARRFSSRGVEYEDLYQVACLACVQAIRGFDPALGVRFSAYATPTLVGKARNYIRDKGAALRFPRTLQEQLSRLQNARDRFFSAHRREPAPRELADSLNWPLEKVLSALQAQSAQRLYSLDQEDGEGQTLARRLPSPEESFLRWEQRSDLAQALARLSDRERQLLALRFQARCSQRETARRMDMTQMQVSRLERRALETLRKEMDV